MRALPVIRGHHPSTEDTLRKRIAQIAIPLVALSLVAAACSKDKKSADTTAAPAETTAAPAATTAAETSAAGAAETTAAAAAETTAAAAAETTAAPAGTTASLKAAGCPSPLVIQTDWFPEADHGWSYQLIGANGTEDAKAGKYSGPVGDITVELRAGGPFVNFSSPANQMYSAPDVFMAYVDTGDAIRNATKQPAVAIFAPYDKGPQIIQWDPAVYPDVSTVADIGKVAKDGQILVFGGQSYTDYLVGKGIWKKSQLDATYDGSPKRFTAEKGLFQQGYATNEPFSYENLIKDWMKPVKFAFTHDSGFEIYQSALSVRPETIKDKADCLKAIVPMFQKAQLDYINNPGPINSKLTTYVADMKQFWQLTDQLNAAAVAIMKDQKLVSDGAAGYLGGMDCARVQKLIDEFNPIEKANNVEGVKDGLKCEEIVDNSFLDKNIKLGS